MEIKTVKDYYKLLYDKFPDVPKEDIRRICNYGWKALYLHNSYGGDVLMRTNSFWCYIGMLKKNSLKHFAYYIKKLTVRLRVLYRKKKVEWDGYYYFALTELAYLKYLKLKNSKGRPKKWFNFGLVFMYLLLDECKINESNNKYIFRIPYPTKIKFKFCVPELITDKAELIIIRSPLKFKDITIYDNNYDVL